MHPSELCLLDVPGLEGLAKTCQEMGVTLTAHGGLVRRLAQARAGEASARIPDVYGLTPFGSDIDLVHDGPPELTPSVLRSIASHVPGSESFRWEVRSEAEDVRFQQALQTSDIVPVNLLRLSTRARSGFEDPWEALDDIHKSAYRFIRNGFYPTSPRFRAGRDLELFAALLYLRALADAGRVGAENPDLLNVAKPGESAVRDVLTEAMSRTTAIKLQESAYLRARLRQLVRNLAVSMSRSARSRLPAIGDLSDLLRYLEDQVPALRGMVAVFCADPSATIVGSERLGGDTYRLPPMTEGWVTAEEAAETLNEAIRMLPHPRRPSLPEDHRVVLASQPLAIEAGNVFSEDSLGESQDIEHELVELAIPMGTKPATSPDKGVQSHKEEDLAMIFALVDETYKQTAAFFSAPSACTFAHLTSPTDSDQLVCVRGSCFRVLERAAGIVRQLLPVSGSPQLRIFLVGRHGEAG